MHLQPRVLSPLFLVLALAPLSTLFAAPDSAVARDTTVVSDTTAALDSTAALDAGEIAASAQSERQRTLQAAQAARAAAQRSATAELDALSQLESQIAARRSEINAQVEALQQYRDTAIGWQQRVRDAQQGQPAEADATYDALRGQLRQTRAQLAAALDQLVDEPSTIPELPDSLSSELLDDQARLAISERRQQLRQQIADAMTEERKARVTTVNALVDEAMALNKARLALLPFLSTDKRDAITGFTEAGWHQARAEGSHLALLLRYLNVDAAHWWRSFRAGQQSISWWGSLLRLIPWLLLIAAFTWWRRHSPPMLQLLDRRVAERDRAERRFTPSRSRQLTIILRGVHRPLEWLLLVLLGLYLLPASAQSRPEVELFAVILIAIFGGALVIHLIDVLAEVSARGRRRYRYAAEVESDQLRLRSLRLVGRSVIGLALLLTLSQQLVGKGTIYAWILTLCWLIALVLVLILIRWWRERVFEAVEKRHRKSAMQQWALANRVGWKSFIAAALATVQLVSQGIYKSVQRNLGRFDLTRRVHAYLFRRELDRLEGQQSGANLKPIGDELRALFDPEARVDEWVEQPGRDAIADIERRLESGIGGVVALLGARGQGKSTCLRRIERGQPGSVFLHCDYETGVDTLSNLLGRHNFDADAAQPLPTLILLDDAQALIQPSMGGLERFDQVLAFARQHSHGTLWVLALDTSLWPFLRRARDERPIFDATLQLQAWNEEEIASAIEQRCRHGEIAPSFDDLLDRLPPGSDEYDRQEALQAKRAGYFRLIWDYCRGNPGIAMEVWRSSLRTSDSGDIRVRPMQVPDMRLIESLPDTGLFVLRATLQLHGGGVHAISAATRLSVADVETAVRFGQKQGFLVEQDGRIGIAWPWLRPVLQLLERRHLLVNL